MPCGEGRATRRRTAGPLVDLPSFAVTPLFVVFLIFGKLRLCQGQTPGISSAPGGGPVVMKDGPVDDGMYPFMASLRRPTGRGEHFCGGSLISRRHILTAAHCITLFNIWQPAVHLGRHQREGALTEDIEVIETVRSFLHPSFDETAVQAGYDLAILELARPTLRHPVALTPRPLNLNPGTTLKVLGWGAASDDLEFESELHEADVPYVAPSKCNSPESYNKAVHPFLLMCAGDGTTDACRGDSGGPLLLLEGRRRTAGRSEPTTRAELIRPVQVGVVSWGYGCGLERYPGVYSRVSSYVDWIRSIVPSVDSVAQTNPPAAAALSSVVSRDSIVRLPFAPEAQQHDARGPARPSGPQQDLWGGSSGTAQLPELSPRSSEPVGADAGRVCREWNRTEDSQVMVASAERYPYIVSLRTAEGMHRCTGAMIDRWHLVSSAVCVAPSIGVGELPIACIGCTYSVEVDPALEPSGEQIRAVYAELPPIWQGLGTEGMSGDLAVIRLERPTALGRTPIRLAPPGTRLAANCTLRLLGWGSLQLGGPISPVLHESDLPFVDRRTCSERWEAYAMQLSELQLCAGGVGVGGTCDGDQGAPLILSVDSDPRHDILVGVASFGPPEACGGGDDGVPDIFTDVPAFNEFIRNAAGMM